MLMLANSAPPPALGNFYFSPVRLGAVASLFEPGQLTEPRQRHRRRPKLDLELDVKPKARRHEDDEDDEEENKSAYAKWFW